jgi:hypothetical protein
MFCKALCLVACLVATPKEPELHKWTDASGKVSIDAEYFMLEFNKPFSLERLIEKPFPNPKNVSEFSMQDVLIVRKPDGVFVGFAFSMLSNESQKLALALRAKEMDSTTLPTWTDVTGKSKIKAEFAYRDYKVIDKKQVFSVRLRKTDGHVIRVPFDKLSKESQSQAKRYENRKSIQYPEVERFIKNEHRMRCQKLSELVQAGELDNALDLSKELLWDPRLREAHDAFRLHVRRDDDQIDNLSMSSFDKAIGCCDIDGGDHLTQFGQDAANAMWQHPYHEFAGLLICFTNAERMLIWEKHDPTFEHFQWLVPDKPELTYELAINALDNFGDETIFAGLPYAEVASVAKKRLRAIFPKKPLPPKPQMGDSDLFLDVAEQPDKFVGKEFIFMVWIEPSTLNRDDATDGYRLEIRDGGVPYERAESVGNRFGLITNELNIVVPKGIGREAKKLLDPRIAYRVLMTFKVQKIQQGTIAKYVAVVSSIAEPPK